MTLLDRILNFFKTLYEKIKAIFIKSNSSELTDNDQNYVDDPNLMLFNFYIGENGLIPGKTKELGAVLSGYIKDPTEISDIIKLAEMGKKVKVLSKVVIEICDELDAKLRDKGITKYKLDEFGNVLELGTEIESIVNS